MLQQQPKLTVFLSQNEARKESADMDGEEYPARRKKNVQTFTVYIGQNSSAQYAKTMI